MLDINRLREDKEAILPLLAKRGEDFRPLINAAIKADDQRKELQTKADALAEESNSIAKQIGELFKTGQREKAEELKARPTAIKQELQSLREQQDAAEKNIQQALFQIPNVPHELVPTGRDEADNEIIREAGVVPQLHGEAVPHWELAIQYGLIDFEVGTKITGAGFPVYMGKGARLQRALISFFLDEAEKAGYMEVMPPLMVNEASGYGTGQLPDKEGQMYHVTEDDLYLIPTAEVPITNIFRDTIQPSEDLPILRCGYTPCFRREAGSYGKDVRGLNRLHQFDKVEIVAIAHPDKSYAMLDEMVKHVEGLLVKLELPYRVARLCAGDLGFTAALTYDMEVFSAAQERWLETSSISCFETFQANRLKLRYKDENGKNRAVHTLNGSALALPRILAALLENNQLPEGIRIPPVLVPYTGFDMITKP